MPTQNPPNRSKLTIRVWAPIFEALVARTDAACLRRDFLISKTLQMELPRIKIELPHANTPKARRYIEARLRALFATGSGSKQISLALDPSVATELESVCTDLNIPRESLLNRLFLLLGASGEFLADHFFEFTPEPISQSDFQADENKDDLTPFETLPRNLIPSSWYRAGSFDVRALALDLTRADEASASYDSALAPLGRVVSVVSDPFRWYRWMLLMKLQQDEIGSREAGKLEVVAAMEAERWIYTPFGVLFEEKEMHGLNCCMLDKWVDDDSPSLMPAPSTGSPAQADATTTTDEKSKGAK